MKKVLVTGAGGFLGARILDQWRGKFELCSFPRGFLATADESTMFGCILRQRPDVIIHTAAMSNTRSCEDRPEDSYRANVMLAEWVARAAAEVGAKLLACSSDQVYAGQSGKRPLPESTLLSPTNVYGRHKLKMERRVLAICPDAVLLRLPWMYDFPGYHLPLRSNLPMNLLRAAKTGEPMHFSCNDYRGVGYVREVIRNLVPAMELPGGVYNFGSDNDVDMFQTAHRFAELMRADVTLVQDDWARDLLMDTQKLESFGITFSGTGGAFKQCLADYRLDTYFLIDGPWW